MRGVLADQPPNPHNVATLPTDVRVSTRVIILPCRSPEHDEVETNGNAHERESSLRKRQRRYLAVGSGSAIGCSDGGAYAERELRRSDVADRDRTISSCGGSGPEHQALLRLIGTLVVD